MRDEVLPVRISPYIGKLGSIMLKQHRILTFCSCSQNLGGMCVSTFHGLLRKLRILLSHTATFLGKLDIRHASHLNNTTFQRSFPRGRY